MARIFLFMPSLKNTNTVQQLKDRLKKAKSIVLADYSGLPVNLQQKLRNQIKQADGELIVTKNTLLKLALKDSQYPIDSLLNSLTGPNITLLSYDDEIAPIKTLAEFSKEHNLPKIKAGFLQKDPLTKNQVVQLAKLPTKIELLTTITGTLKSPITGFVNVLSGNFRKLIYTIKAISAKADRPVDENNKGGEK